MSKKTETTKIEKPEEKKSTSIYTEEEQKLLDKTKSVRMTFVDDIVKTSNPNNRDYASKARVANELMTSVDTSINNAANTRLKHQDSADNEIILTSVAETLKAISVKNAEGATANLIVPDTVKKIEVKEGETTINPGQLEVDKYIKKD